MLKKNQIALILLTLVLMLTVYFLRSPFDKGGNKNPVGGDDLPTGRLEELAALRSALRDERTLTVMSFDEVIASNEKTVAEKNVAVEEKRKLQQLMEKELVLELKIIGTGYQDSFVHATDQGIEIIVVSPTESADAADDIIVMALLQFGEIYNSASVEFKTVQQVIGKVA